MGAFYYGYDALGRLTQLNLNGEMLTRHYHQAGREQLRQQGQLTHTISTMIRVDKELHWWYRAREQGADELFITRIYD